MRKVCLAQNGKGRREVGKVCLAQNGGVWERRSRHAVEEEGVEVTEKLGHPRGGSGLINARLCVDSRCSG